MHTIVKTHSKLIYKLHFHLKHIFELKTTLICSHKAHIMCWFTCLKSGVDHYNFSCPATPVNELTCCYMLHLKNNNAIYVFNRKTLAVCVYIVREIIVLNHAWEQSKSIQVHLTLSTTLNAPIDVRAAHIWWQLWGGSTPVLRYVRIIVTTQNTTASASTTLCWTNAALASTRAVLKTSPACMPSPGWHTGREAWITPRVTFPNRIAALMILTWNSNFNINQTWYKCERHKTHTIIIHESQELKKHKRTVHVRKACERPIIAIVSGKNAPDPWNICENICRSTSPHAWAGKNICKISESRLSV